MTLRADHVAGLAFVALGVLVLAFSGDLPFGRLSAPGAGMMPKLVAGLMIVFAVVIIAGGAASQAFSEIDWSDRWHAVSLVAITSVAVACYQSLGFLVTMSLLVFALLVVVERRPAGRAAVYSIGLTLLAYGLFRVALKAPLERGILGF